MPAAVAVPLASAAIAGGASIYGAHKASSANQYGTQAAVAAQNRAAELEAKSAAEQLAFAREQEAANQKRFDDMQARNYQLWQAREANLTPYRRLGAGSILQLSQPIPR